MSKELVRSLYQAFSRGEVETVLGAMDPAISWHEPESHPYRMDGGAWVGPNAIVENLFLKLGTEWEGFTLTPTTFSDAGNRVIVEGRLAGTYKATGNKIDAQFCHIWDVKDGKVAAFQGYTDTAQFQGAM